jgi:pimeloyl-ACP methyl ester carboxylesterase
MKAPRILIPFVLSLASLALAQDVTGDWHGTLSVNGAELRLVLHISKNSDGSLKATLDSIDQNANGIPVTSATLGGTVLSLNVDAVHGSYAGRVNVAANEIAGTWTQGASLELTFYRGGIPTKAAAKPTKPSDIDGDWLGAIDTGMGELRLLLHISNTDQGLAATVDIPDQKAKGLPVTSIKRSGKSLQFEMKEIGGAYEGNINSNLDTLTGAWTQLGKSLPLTFKRVKNAVELDRSRPQNPSRPYPYREEDVRYKNPAANIELAATLTIPSGKGPFPAVLLMAGSGPHDRDETVMGHKPFLVLSDHLTRKGIVVLRADKRGVGDSGGTYSDAVMADFASDADAGVAFLKTRNEVDAHKVGLVGHSEGAIEAPMSAVHNPDVAFVVMMAGPGVRGDQLLPEQLKLIESASGKSPEEVEKDLAAERVVLAILEKEKDDSVRERKLRESLKGKVPDAQIGMQIKAVDSPWFRGLLEYDPAVTLSQIKCPVLVLDGEKDLQVPPEQNLPPIRKALASAGNKNFEVDELPGLNHLFQTAKTGAVSEYSEIKETIAPAVLEKIASWILKLTETESFPANVAEIQGK